MFMYKLEVNKYNFNIFLFSKRVYITNNWWIAIKYTLFYSWESINLLKHQQVTAKFSNQLHN